MRRSKLLAAVGIAATLTIGVRAYVTYAKWSSSSVGFYVNPQNADVVEDLALTAVLYGAEVWETQSGAFFDVLYGGKVSDTTTGYDNRNVVIFRDASNGGAIATTYSWYTGTTLLDADIIFWDGAYKFFTGWSGCSSGAYIEDIAAHEFGHALGLNHTSVTGATMYPSYKSCSQELRTLAADDVAGVESLYPGGSDPGDTNTAPTIGIASPLEGASFTKDISISFGGSASDQQDGDLTSAIGWTSSVDGPIGRGGSFSRKLSVGTHIITAKATDSGGLTGSGQVTVTVSESTASTPTLTAKGYTARTQKKVDLTWTGFTSSTVEIYRNGTLLLTAENDGAYTDAPIAQPSRNGSSLTYVVCSAGGLACSNEALVTF